MVRLDGASDIEVVISAATSIDGKIAAARGAQIRLSSDADTARVHRLRSKCDAILVGISTVLSDDPMLNVRHARRGKNASPVRVILDSAARIPLHSKIAQTSRKIKTIIAVSKKAPKARVSAILSKTGADVVVAGSSRVDIRQLLLHLSGMGICSVLVEGGGTVNWEFIRKKLADRMIIAVSPYVLGGKESVSLVEGSGFSSLSGSPEMRLTSARRLGGHVILSYDICYT